MSVSIRRLATTAAKAPYGKQWFRKLLGLEVGGDDDDRPASLGDH